MKVSIAMVVALSAVMGMAGSSYAAQTSTVMPPQSSNAATPAVPGTDGTPATPAVPGNPVARAAIARAQVMHEEHGVSDEYADTDGGVTTRPEITRPEITRPEITRPQIERPEMP